ncbi:MAG: sigma-70 family RNA polymerase sigma factor [Neomegalonema sp.]
MRPSATDSSDEELIVRVARSQDKAAFAVLFSRWSLKVKAFMIRSGAPPDAAEEAAQETFVALWRRAETFDPDRASAAAWLFAIARNKRVDLLRRGARPEPDPEDPTFLPAPPLPADHQLAAQNRDVAVRNALKSLTEDQREVVVLSCYEGCAHSEISERLGIPLGTVKSRLRLAFGKLRSELGVEFQEELSGS